MTMINVTPYGSHGDLFEAVGGRLARRGGVLGLARVVVPSVYFRDWLQVQLARRFGICMGLEFLTPQEFVGEVFRAAGISGALGWTKRRLQWAVLERMEAGNAVVPFLDEEAPIRDRFAMARMVADRFEQYAHYRPEMVEAWMQGESFLGSNDQEDWQRALWQCLCSALGGEPGLLPSRLLQHSDALREAFPRATVLGSGTLDPLLVQILLILAQHGCDVHVHLALPCLDYLADLRQGAVHAPAGGEGDPETFEFGIETSQNPLLTSMGRQAAGTFVLLGQLDEQYGNWPEATARNTTENPSSLLHDLQAGIRKNTKFGQRRVPDGKEAASKYSSSLSVHECHGPRRELEVLRDELLRAFQEFPDLTPGDVLIAAPSLHLYAPLVSAVFRTGENPLPVRLTEIPPGEGDEVLEGLLAVLGVACGGRGRLSEVLDLLRLRAVRVALGVGDNEEMLEFLAKIIRSAGLTQGFGDGPGGWQFTLDRLAAGVFFGPEEPPIPGGQLPEGARFQLPVADLMGSNPAGTDRLLDWLFNLLGTLREWQSPAQPKAWADRLRAAGFALLGGEDDRMGQADKVLALLTETECTAELDAHSVMDWLAVESAESNRRAPISGATAFGRLKQLHNTPCRILALVGMQNDNFPARVTSPSWDLLRASPKIWDRNARVEDRQMFLDSVLVPTDRLVITASTRNVRTNKKQPLSTCVNELLAAAANLGVPKESIVREHPLQPFSVKYFKIDTPLPRPMSEGVAHIARTLHSADKQPSPLHRSRDGRELSPDANFSSETPIERLIAFWKDPAKAFLKALGIAIPYDEDDERSLDRNPLEVTALSAWGVKSAILEQILHGRGSLSLEMAKLQANRNLPPGDLGEAALAKNRTLAEPLAHAVKKALGTSCEAIIELEGFRVTGQLPLSHDGEALVAHRPGKFDDARDFMAPWITANLAAAAGRSLPTWIYDETTPSEPMRRDSIEQKDAEANLKHLLAGYWEGHSRPLCYAPKTSHAMAKAKEAAGRIPAARGEWERTASGRGEDGEGHGTAAALAWRDCDPFDSPDDWNRWCDAIAVPLRAWGKF